MRLGALGAILAGLAVAAGAFGAHALHGRLDAHSIETFETAVRYQLVHSLALVVAYQRATSVPAARHAGYAFAIGILLFSGSLYALALGAPHAVGFVTPVGGLSFIAGWALLAASFRAG